MLSYTMLQGRCSFSAILNNSIKAYNLGIELAHIIVIALFLLASYIFVNLINVNRRDWNLVISSGIAGIAITIMFEAKYW